MTALSMHDEGPLGRARSSYADMLHDDERNHAYNMAIKATVHHLVKSPDLNPNRNRFYNCCDVGLGSGLLSMMIVRAFRELNYAQFHVTGFEEYAPMARCASKIIQANGMQQDITIVGQRVQDVQRGEWPTFDLLVAELLDTELIGENCLEAYEHVRLNLCSLECLFIPSEAAIHIQLVDSRYLRSRQILDSIDMFIEVDISDDIKNCSGLSDIDDLQMDNIPDLVELSAPSEVFKFNFGQITRTSFREQRLVSMELIQDVPSVPVILFWWEIKMYNKSLFDKYLSCGPVSEHSDDGVDISFTTLSCAPSWIRNNPEYANHFYKERDEYIARLYGRGVWREHWIRGVYTVGSNAKARHLVGRKKGSIVDIYAYHDAVSHWFELEPSLLKYPRTCTCGVHRVLSRSELAFLGGQGEAWTRVWQVHCQSVDRDKVKRAEFCCAVEPEGPTTTNNPALIQKKKWSIRVFDLFSQEMEVSLDDYHLQADVAWLNVMNMLLNSSTKIPKLCTNLRIYCSRVVFKDLSRICDKVNNCQGFDLSFLDAEIETNSLRADNPVDSLFLWEYESEYLGERDPICVCTVEATSELPHRTTIELPQHSGLGRALVFWSTLTSRSGEVICTGPRDYNQQPDRSKRRIDWNRNFKQLVYFVRDNRQADPDAKIVVQVEVNTSGLRASSLISR